MNTLTQSAPANTAAALLEIASIMDETGDQLHARRIRELKDKWSGGKFTAAFCGHFSAGKSTLVNRLCGAQLLPSSPVPTSANVVSIRNGEPCARIVQIVDGEERMIEVPPEQLEAYCVNGSEFASVDISYPIPSLGAHTVLLDTPGIDSTDDAHRMATESALHLADVVFYVMDYNHVQSEINFAFAKRLKDWGKPLYLIVNQIDKHREQELAFSEYRRSVEEAFANWHLEPAGIVYLSLRQPDHPHQEFASLERLFTELAEVGEPLNRCSVDASARHLLDEHGKWMEAASSDERERLIEAAGGEEELASVKSELQQLEQEMSAYREAAEQFRVKLRQEAESLLDNANITPAATRDLAHAFLESRKPGFKAGLLFAGAKTAAEQQRRQEAFLTDFTAQVQASIEWHLLELLRQEAHQLSWRDETLESRLSESFTGVVDASLLLEHVQPGAVFSNEATMNYCKSLAASVKASFRRRALELGDELAERVAAASAAAAAQAQARSGALAAQAQALAQLAAQDAAAAAHKQRLAALLPPAPQRPALPVPAPASGAPRAAGAAAAADVPPQAAAKPRSGAAPAAAAQQAPVRAAQADGAMLGPQRRAAAMLERAAELLAPHEPLAAAALAMRGKAGRLKQSRFTIALFGAFSAGKSSFANALIGQPALPVSPNPTTAAINRIVPPTADEPHGTARIFMKSRAAMLEDIRYSLALLGEDIGHADEQALLRLISGLKPDSLHPGGRPHYSFLKAVLQGWDSLEGQLGEQLRVDEAMYRRFVAEESRSCFVQEIELYYDSPLTAQGIVLVDTPGADSVNARHTGVAFNYIKNADAILFVTYYNHAFSQADRQFLMQLGRVKDQFELDKMFFIVNAADLASSESELAGVLKHVEDNLLLQGIRHPRIYPVSSLSALDAKLTDNTSLLNESGISAFEQSFLAFTSGELGQLAVASAEQEIKRAIESVSSWLEAAQGDEATRTALRSELEGQAQEALRIAAGVAREASFEPLEQELRELLYYVLQRLQFRFGDHYNYAFNPSVLQDDGRDMKKMLWSCWLELQRLLQNELSEELLATTLRMENTLGKLISKQFAAVSADAEKQLPGLNPGSLEAMPIPTPEIGASWQTDAVERKLLWSRFKNPRHFFEGEGKAALRKELETLAAPSLQVYVDGIIDRWKALYLGHWKAGLEAAEEKLAAEIRSYADGRLVSLDQTVDPALLKELHKSLMAVINSD
ncbi:dynamin family protein [Paenibacillus abyssi]|uniref:Dynamin N-terminal domain-containing protein n=1 Tax=Paenibacillus abyssi TaxID=1340531 RepID=A0A917CI96_9BACL|nr:dynamin family protein [Paenibacillus abyssi]GGF89258.1 hypothetical protein GCM10010916_03240 [Paenibacillus abyssi]